MLFNFLISNSSLDICATPVLSDTSFESSRRRPRRKKNSQSTSTNIWFQSSKTAELFKQEKLAPQGIDANVALDSQPCFLQDWFLVFWDLYCASPDQRNQCESSWEAREFHDRGFIPPSVDPYPMENGMNGIPPQIGNYHHHHPGMSSHSAHPMHNGYYHPPSYMNHQPGPSHLNPPANHSTRGRKRTKTEKPQERNFADSEESINRLRGPPPPYVPRDQKPQIVKEEPQEMMPQVMIPLKTEEKIPISFRRAARDHPRCSRAPAAPATSNLWWCRPGTRSLRS
ncbi:single-stranded DNA-binding protein 3 [Ditylenchus destructor]|nr:single-stranded DNA-binding protein 3 [Ditylenchus destructor]